MQRHLVHFVRAAGYADASLYGHLQAAVISDELQKANAQGRPVVLVGYSQGGLEAMNVARRLERSGVPVALLLLIAARGLGRIFPHRWRADMRHVPPNVALCLNYFAEGDLLGSDPWLEGNEVVATSPESRVENIGFSRRENMSHIGISSCYPLVRIPAVLKTRLHDRLLSELAAITKA